MPVKACPHASMVKAIQRLKKVTGTTAIVVRNGVRGGCIKGMLVPQIVGRAQLR
jgi:hypothetical protein